MVLPECCWLEMGSDEEWYYLNITDCKWVLFKHDTVGILLIINGHRCRMVLLGYY